MVLGMSCIPLSGAKDVTSSMMWCYMCHVFHEKLDVSNRGGDDMLTKTVLFTKTIENDVKPERRTLFKKATDVALQNAEDLFEESLLLFENKFYPRAFSLGILTCEEMAKAFLYRCVSLEILQEDEISKLVKEHEEKIRQSGDLMALAWLFSEHLDEINKAIEHDKNYPDHKDHIFNDVLGKLIPDSARIVVKNILKAQNLKLDSLYVHVQENNIINPRDVIGRKKCDELFSLIGRTIGMLNFLKKDDEIFAGMTQKFLKGMIDEIKETAKNRKKK